MAKRTRSEDIEETDRVEGHKHPRENFRLAGQDAALARAARAIRGGKPPQAWLIAGPPGIGKATLAYRIARYCLKYGATADGAGRSVRAGERSGFAPGRGRRRIPGLLVLKRAAQSRDRQA